MKSENDIQIMLGSTTRAVVRLSGKIGRKNRQKLLNFKTQLGVLEWVLDNNRPPLVEKEEVKKEDDKKED